MNFLKIHMPDCAKAFAVVKEYGGIAGTYLGKGIGTGVGWLGIAIAFVGVFVAMFAFKSLIGMCVALVDVMKIAGRFTKSGIDGLHDGEKDSQHSGMPRTDFDGRLWRRSA